MIWRCLSAGGSHLHQPLCRKLQEQFQQQTGEIQETAIFSGVSIHVNGLTNPTHQELKHLMSLHGGNFQNYYSRSTVTHIICSNLPDAKIKHLEKEKNPLPIVKPEWIVRSIEAGKLLPVHEFLLWQKGAVPGQKKIGRLAIKSLHEDKAEHSAEHAQQLAAKLRADCDVLKGPPKSSKDDPDFVNSFYKSSRLHFIGTWKARLEGLLTTMADTAPSPTSMTSNTRRDIIHLDMDCFFASVAEASNPEFKGEPLAVCHSASAKGTGEISSANYEAREYGIHAGMFVGRATQLCPKLIVVPYDFPKYEEISEIVYRTLFQATAAVQPVSCDEAYVDVTGLGDPEEIARYLRNEIEERTGCTASAGIGSNLLLARLATAKAKPNGQFRIGDNDAAKFLGHLPVEELPGVGWATSKKLARMAITTVGELATFSREKLQSELGTSAGGLLYEYSRGRDLRRVEPPRLRKSIGSEVNWGVRFTSEEDPVRFLKDLALEVSTRMHSAGVRGRTVTLKLLKKRKGAGEPIKYLGCGECDAYSRSTTVHCSTNSAEEIFNRCLEMFKATRLPPDVIRGMGIHVSKLDGHHHQGLAETEARTKQLLIQQVFHGQQQNPCQQQEEEGPVSFTKGQFVSNNADSSSSLEWDDSSPSPRSPQSKRTSSFTYIKNGVPFQEMTLSQIDADAWADLPQDVQLDLVQKLPRSRTSLAEGVIVDKGKAPALENKKEEEVEGEKGAAIEPLPSFSQIDPTVLEALPLGVRREIEMAYGLLQHHLPKKSPMGGTKRPLKSASMSLKGSAPKQRRLDAVYGATKQPPDHAIPSSILPSSFSQIDQSVLSELPKEMRKEIEIHLNMATFAKGNKRRKFKEEIVALQKDEENEDEISIDATPGSQDGESDGGVGMQPQIVDYLLSNHSFTELIEGLDSILNTLLKEHQEEEEEDTELPPTQPLTTSPNVTRVLNAEQRHILHKIKQQVLQTSKICIQSDIESLHKGLKRLTRIPAKYPWFSEIAHSITNRIQHHVIKIYGLPLKGIGNQVKMRESV